MALEGVVANVHDQTGNGSIYGTGANLNLTTNSNLKLSTSWSENGFGEEGMAYFEEYTFNYKKGFITGKYLYLEPDYLNLDEDETTDRAGFRVSATHNFNPIFTTYASGEFLKDNLEDNPGQLTFNYSGYDLDLYLTPTKWPTMVVGFGKDEQTEDETGQLFSSSTEYSLSSSYGIGRFSLFGREEVTQEDDYQNSLEREERLYSIGGYFNSYKWSIGLTGEREETEKIGFGLENQKDTLELGMSYYSSNPGWSGWSRITWIEEQELDTDISETEYQLGIKYQTKKLRWSPFLTIEQQNRTVDSQETLSALTIGVGAEYRLENGLYLYLTGENVDSKYGADDFRYEFMIGKQFDLPIPWVRAYANLSGVTYVDTNENGLWDPGDLVLENVVLGLNKIQAKSNASGNYLFSPFDPGEYALTLVSAPEGYVPAVELDPKLQLRRGEIKRLDIPFIKVAAISGKVFVDTDKTGIIKYNSVGMADVTLIVVSNEKTYKVKTNADGRFAATIAVGDYRVYVDQTTLPNRYVFTTLPELTLTLGKGERQVVNFGVYQKIREVRFDDSNSKTKKPAISVIINPVKPKVGAVIQISVTISQPMNAVLLKPKEGGAEIGLSKQGDNWSGQLKIPMAASGKYICEIILTDLQGRYWTEILEIEIEN